eukprot:1052523-Amphidinium_carterae.1
MGQAVHHEHLPSLKEDMSHVTQPTGLSSAKDHGDAGAEIPAITGVRCSTPACLVLSLYLHVYHARSRAGKASLHRTCKHRDRVETRQLQSECAEFRHDVLAVNNHAILHASRRNNSFSLASPKHCHHSGERIAPAFHRLDVLAVAVVDAVAASAGVVGAALAVALVAAAGAAAASLPFFTYF